MVIKTFYVAERSNKPGMWLNFIDKMMFYVNLIQVLSNGEIRWVELTIKKKQQSRKISAPKLSNWSVIHKVPYHR